MFGTWIIHAILTFNWWYFFKLWSNLVSMNDSFSRNILHRRLLFIILGNNKMTGLIMNYFSNIWYQYLYDSIFGISSTWCQWMMNYTFLEISKTQIHSSETNVLSHIYSLFLELLLYCQNIQFNFYFVWYHMKFCRLNIISTY